MVYYESDRFIKLIFKVDGLTRSLGRFVNFYMFVRRDFETLRHSQPGDRVRILGVVKEVCFFFLTVWNVLVEMSTVVC